MPLQRHHGRDVSSCVGSPLMAGLESDWESERQMRRQRNAGMESQEMGQEPRSLECAMVACVCLRQHHSCPCRSKQMQSREPERRREGWRRLKLEQEREIKFPSARVSDRTLYSQEWISGLYGPCWAKNKFKTGRNLEAGIAVYRACPVETNFAEIGKFRDEILNNEIHSSYV